MADYIEDPFGRVVGVHWADDDDPDGGGPEEPDPCGMAYIPEAAPFISVSRWGVDVFVPYLLQITDPNLILYAPPPDGSGYATQNYIQPPLLMVPVYPYADLYYFGPASITSITVTIEVWGANNLPPYDVEYPYDLAASSLSPGGLIEPYEQVGIDLYYNTNARDITADTVPDETVSGATSATIEIVNSKIKVDRIWSVWGGEPRFYNKQTAHGFGRHNLYSSRGVRMLIQFHGPHQTSGAPPPQPELHGGANGWSSTTIHPPSPHIPFYAAISGPPAPGSLRVRQRSSSLIRRR